MDSLIIYLIIGAIWLFQVITKKKLEAQKRQRQDYGPPKQKDLFDELKEFMEEKAKSSHGEEVLKKTEQIEEQEQKLEEVEIVEEEEVPEPEPVPVQLQAKEALLKKIFDKYKPESVQPQLQIETPSASYFLSDLSSEKLEEGIILSTILGPPRSVQLLKGKNYC